MATEALVLAAGAGTRFGGGKLLAPYGDGVLLEGALRAAQTALMRAVTVVTGADGEAVAAAVRAFDPEIRIVHAPDHAEGMGASLRAGVASLGEDVDVVVILLGDMPRVPAAIVRRLAGAVEGGAEAAAPLCGGRRGNPVALSRRLFPQLLSLEGDEGARRVLAGLGDRLVLVPTDDDGVLFDVDRPDDL